MRVATIRIMAEAERFIVERFVEVATAKQSGIYSCILKI
jgi:hypothetical protein